MDRSTFPVEAAIALLVLIGIVFIGRYVTERTIPAAVPVPAATQNRL